jgi:hypothetical protein
MTAECERNPVVDFVLRCIGLRQTLISKQFRLYAVGVRQ